MSFSLSNYLFLLAALVALSSCVHRLTMHSRDGERLDGRWRFAREGNALVQVHGADGEVLVGMLKPVARRSFFDSYQQTFGRGAIDAEGPDLSSFGNALFALPGSANPLAEMAYGESFDKSSGQSARSISGPLIYWTVNLEGDRRTWMRCFLIGSSHSQGGLGRCKGQSGKEYTVSF
ncbi:MAG TPA: hypothetical protein VJQ55_05565 [Candidatus Binatia bacterium]|nr:hypothetical protein [Candidatus Binatia bacterium]